MKYFCVFGLFVCVLLCLPRQPRALAGSGQAPGEGADRPRVVRASDRPELGANLAGAAKFKLATRKTEYRLGEMFTIDTALLNASNDKGYFPSLQTWVKLQARDAKGEKAQLIRYISAQFLLTPDLYSLLGPNEMDVESFRILAGCDERVFEEEGREAQNDRAAFDHDQFVSFGQACLKITRPGTYTFTATIENQHVVTAPAGPPVKTAVGTITSQPLTITITGQ